MKSNDLTIYEHRTAAVSWQGAESVCYFGVFMINGSNSVGPGKTVLMKSDLFFVLVMDRVVL
jgi:hypothetical protein